MISRKDDVNEQALTAELQQIAQRINVKDIEEHICFPRYFQIGTTRLCNARCPFCTSEQWDKSIPYISDRLFDKIVDELSRYADWIKVVCLQRSGEPLMDKRITERVRRMKEIGVKCVNFATNASLLTEQKSRELLNAGLDDIMFSIDSVDKEVYETMRVGLNYETVIKNIKTFFKVRDELRPNCVIRVRGVSDYYMDKKEDREQLKRWESFWDKLKRPHDRIYMKRAHNWGNQKQWEGHRGKYDWIYHPCVLLWSTMHITAMGYVAFCSMDYDAKINMGDLNKESIAEVWRGEKFRQMRKVHASGRRNEIRMCQGCRLFDFDFSLEDWQEKGIY